jgi:hypothetical protein
MDCANFESNNSYPSSEPKQIAFMKFSLEDNVPEVLEAETACEFVLESKVQFKIPQFKINLCTGIGKKVATKIVIKTVNFRKNMD